MIDFKKDRTTEPNDANLKIVLGDSFLAYRILVDKLIDFEADLEWRYYKDGGWLAKVTRKKKTIFWGEPNDGYFTIGFHFNERNRQDVMGLEIAKELKRDFSAATPNGSNLISLRVYLNNESKLPDVYQLIDYKRSIK